MLPVPTYLTVSSAAVILDILVMDLTAQASHYYHYCKTDQFLKTRNTAFMQRTSYCQGFRSAVRHSLWFQSYLSNRRQIFTTQSSQSQSIPLNCGVPKDPYLVLSSSLHTPTIPRLSFHHNVYFHLYADDTQLYDQTLPFV